MEEKSRLGQQWAKEMFDHTSHDFGTVARGAKMEHRFTLENIYEESPATLTALVDRLDSPWLGHCFDIGHWRLFGSTPQAEWLAAIAPRLLHLHLHDNRGLSDDHLPVGEGIIDYAPTYVTSTSYDDSLLAAGATLDLTRKVMDGDAANGFAIVRPPGHHAEPKRSMGFCIFNNIAVAAQDALERGAERVLIVDYDAHHGNGTQAYAWKNEQVAYLSTHQENIYPGSGAIQEATHARGRIVNVPLPSRSGDATFALITDRLIVPFVQKFQPSLILVSAGFDSHWDDPLTSLGLTTAGFHAISKV